MVTNLNSSRTQGTRTQLNNVVIISSACLKNPPSMTSLVIKQVGKFINSHLQHNWVGKQKHMTFTNAPAIYETRVKTSAKRAKVASWKRNRALHKRKSKHMLSRIFEDPIISSRRVVRDSTSVRGIPYTHCPQISVNHLHCHLSCWWYGVSQ